MRSCPYCGQAIDDYAQFCPLCGRTATPGLSGGAAAMQAQGPTSGKAIGSLVSGFFFFLLPAAIVAIVLGHISYSEINRSQGRIQGKGIALAGLILEYLGIAFIPVVLIIAAIAIPNLLRFRMSANEASAVGTLRTYSYAMGNYAARCPKIGFPKTFANLGPGPGDCERANFVNAALSADSPERAGYIFHYKVAEPNNLGQVSRFVITADPITSATGLRHFYTDYTGVIRWSTSGPPDENSQPLR